MALLADSILPESPPRRAVLIVDDHVDSADIMAHALQLNGHETQVAYEPLSALALAAEFRPQVAILDVNLPTMDGYELGAALRVQLPECRFIALTGETASLNCLRSQWAGFHGFLTKPVALDELLLAVSSSRPSGTFTRRPPTDAPLSEPLSRRRRERVSIDVESSETIRYWTTSLVCTEAVLRAAVHAVGVNSEDVRRYLKR